MSVPKHPHPLLPPDLLPFSLDSESLHSLLSQVLATLSDTSSRLSSLTSLEELHHSQSDAALATVDSLQKEYEDRLLVCEEAKKKIVRGM